MTGKVSHFSGDVPIRSMMKDTCSKHSRLKQQFQGHL